MLTTQEAGWVDAVSMAAATVAMATLTSVEAETAVAIKMRHGAATVAVAAAAEEEEAEAEAEEDGLGLVAVPWAAGSVRSAATAHCLCSRTWLRWRPGTCVMCGRWWRLWWSRWRVW
jgi:hypothetical protein